jgi:hypothetical protein
MVTRRSSVVRPYIKFDIAKPSGRDVLRVEGLTKRFGEKKVFEGFTFNLDARRQARRHRPERHRQVDAAQAARGRVHPRRGHGRLGPRDLRRLLRAGPPRGPGGGLDRLRVALSASTRRHHRAGALGARQAPLQRRGRPEEDRDPLRRRGRAPRPREAHPAQEQRGAARRAHQPPRRREHRRAPRGAHGLQGHGHRHEPRPALRLPPRHARPGAVREGPAASSTAPTRSSCRRYGTEYLSSEDGQAGGRSPLRAGRGRRRWWWAAT